MVFALLEALGVTKGLREALPFLEHIVTDNPELSARAILGMARDAGLRFTDAPAFNIVAQLKANLNAKELFNLTAFDELPKFTSLERAVTPLAKNYSFLVKITGYNALTGERENRHISVVSDNLLTPADIIKSALNIPNQSPGSSVLSNATVSIVSGKVSPFVTQ